MTRDEERRLERCLDAVATAVELPLLFPLMRPDCKKFDAWAERISGSSLELRPRLIGEGVAAISRRERERIAAWPRDWAPAAWADLCKDADEERLVPALLAGAVGAALKERCSSDEDAIRLLEELGPRPEAVEPLVFAIEPNDLWSPAEAQVLDEALAAIRDDLDDETYEMCWKAVVTGEADRLATPRHRRRLARLVGYVRDRLPLADYPVASQALASACAAFERDRGERARLAAHLLVETL